MLYRPCCALGSGGFIPPRTISVEDRIVGFVSERDMKRMVWRDSSLKLRLPVLRTVALSVLLLVSISFTFHPANLVAGERLTFKGSQGSVSPVGVQGGSGPLAAFTWEPCVLCVVPGDVVFFTGNWSVSSSGSIALYTWDFGDGSSVVKSTSPFASHIYGGFPGKWLVTLTVQDSAGLVNSVSELVLFNTVPRFSFHPLKPMVGQLVTFNGSWSFAYYSSNPITRFLWDFGDGTGGSEIVVNHSYSAVGFYRVTLTLVTLQGDPSVSKTLRVRLPGDVNDDCMVNFLDLGKVGSALLKMEGQAGFDPDADLNGDGVVNFADLGIVGANFLRTCT